MLERDWSRIPPQFAYVQPMAEQYDGWLQHHRHQDEKAVNALTKDHIKSLAELYDNIDSRGDAEAISTWLESIPRQQRRDEDGVYWPVFRLFSVFRKLGAKGLTPFNSNRVRYWVADPPFDWTKLPEGIRYISEFAEKFGGIHGDDEVEAFVNNPDEQQMSELAAASERIRLNGDADAVYDWLEQYDTVEHLEAARVMWMLNLMNEAGVPIG